MNVTDGKRSKRAVVIATVAVGISVALIAVFICIARSTDASESQSVPRESFDLSLFLPPVPDAPASQTALDSLFDSFLRPPRPAPAVPPSPLTMFPLAQSLIDKYANDYNQLLGTHGADWVVGDIIAHRSTNSPSVPIGDMAGWSTEVEIVAGRTSAEYVRPDRSVHHYSTCDVRQGGQMMLIGLVPGTKSLMLMQYVAPTDLTSVHGTSCTGGEYFFMTPEQVKEMMATPF